MRRIILAKAFLGALRRILKPRTTPEASPVDPLEALRLMARESEAEARDAAEWALECELKAEVAKIQAGTLKWRASLDAEKLRDAERGEGTEQ